MYFVHKLDKWNKGSFMKKNVILKFRTGFDTITNLMFKAAVCLKSQTH